MSPHPVLDQEYILEQVLHSISRSCASNYFPFGYCGIGLCRPREEPPTPRSTLPCTHTDTLAACAVVSRQWYHLAVSILWGSRAGFQELLSLVSPPRNGSKGDRDVDSQGNVTPKQRGRFEYYCRFVKELDIQFSNSSTDRPLLMQILRQADRATQLCPRLDKLILHADMTVVTGARIVLERLPPPGCRLLWLFFYRTSSSELIAQHLEVVARKLTKLKCLQILFKNGCNIKGLPSSTSDALSSGAINSLRAINGLESLRLDRRLISLDLLNALGGLPQLSSLVFLSSGSSLTTRFSPVVNVELPPQLESGRFKALKELEIMGTNDTLVTYFETSFSSPSMPLENIHLSVSGKLTRSSLAFFERYARSLRKVYLCLEPSSKLQFRFLEGLRACGELTELTIEGPLFLSFQDSDRTVLPPWRNLTKLQVSGDVNPLLLGQTPRDLRQYHPTGEVDMYILGFLAESLPQLIHLCISVLACATRPTDANEYPFQKLERLTLGFPSFINWELQGFDRDQAVRYMATILPPKVDLSWEGEEYAPDERHPMGLYELRDWEILESDHDCFRYHFNLYIVNMLATKMKEVR